MSEAFVVFRIWYRETIYLVLTKYLLRGLAPTWCILGRTYHLPIASGNITYVAAPRAATAATADTYCRWCCGYWLPVSLRLIWKKCVIYHVHRTGTWTTTTVVRSNNMIAILCVGGYCPFRREKICGAKRLGPRDEGVRRRYPITLVCDRETYSCACEDLLAARMAVAHCVV